MNITIHKTQKNEYAKTEFLTREAFWNIYEPGCTEHLMLHNLRKTEAHIEELDISAYADNKLIGHLIITKSEIINLNNKSFEVLCLGPISIDPEFQGIGLGTQIIKHSIEEARKLGYNGIITFGFSHYYSRFGFENAEKFEITTKDGENFEEFMAMPLFENALEDVKGKFHEHQSYIVDPDELEEFEKNFPKKDISEPKFKI